MERKTGFFFHLFIACASALCGSSSPVWAQAPSAADSVLQRKEVIAEYRAGISAADSAHDTAKGVELRLLLAPLCNSSEAQRLYADAAAAADSTGADQLEERALQGLARIHRAKGDLQHALEDADRIAVLIARRVQRDTTVAMSSARARNGALLNANDSIANELDETRLAMHAATEKANDGMASWRIAAMAAAALWLLSVGLLLQRGNVLQRRTRTELAALKAEVEGLKQMPKNRLREETRPYVDIAAPAEVDVVHELAVPPDPLVAGMFMKKAPERLQTLREARAAGDLEKVVRVVHSLKPQLVGMDADLFAPLCAELVRSERTGTPQWNADLDTLDAAIARLLSAN